MISTAIRRATARKLRANTTPHERKLWRGLKELPVFGTHFRRQAPIGRYVVDFFCPAAHLIIELDGGHHNEDKTARQDRARQQWLENEGYRSSGSGIRKSAKNLTPCSNEFISNFMARRMPKRSG